MVPSGDVTIIDVAVFDTALNIDPFHAIEFQPALIGSVCCVQVVPSGDVAAVVDGDIAQNTVPFHATAPQTVLIGKVRCVHVVPSGDVAATVLLMELVIAQNTVPFHTIDAQYAVTGKVL